MNVTATADARPLRQRFLGFLMAPALVLGLAACDTGGGGGFSDEDAAAIRDQIEQVADRLDAVEQRLMDMSAEGGEENEPAQLISEVREVRDDVGEARNMLTEVSQQLADEESEENLEQQQDQNDPLAPPADGGLGDPAIGDDVNQLGNDVEQGIDDLGQDVQEGADDLQDGANDALDNAGDALDGGNDVDDPLNEDPLNDDVNDPAPLEDPLVPNAPDL